MVIIWIIAVARVSITSPRLRYLVRSGSHRVIVCRIRYAHDSRSQMQNEYRYIGHATGKRFDLWPLAVRLSPVDQET